MKSEVELNQAKILVNDVLFYLDYENTERWEVTELFKGGFEATNDYETKAFNFSDLQIGWVISDKTKAFNNQNYRVNYN
jgi:hypothetical protein